MVAKTVENATTLEPKAAHRLSARDRLLAAADELFYAEGVHVVGIDRIVERAGLAKASGARDAKQLGRQLSLVYDGAAVAGRMDKDRAGAAKGVHSAVVALLDAAIPSKLSSRRAR